MSTIWKLNTIENKNFILRQKKIFFVVIIKTAKF